MDFLSTLAEAKEWGAILLLLVIIIVYIQAMFKSNQKLIAAFIALSNEIPKLAQSIENQKIWFESQFKSVNDGLDDIKDAQKSTSDAVDDHEKRIGMLEDKVSEPVIPIPIDIDDQPKKKTIRRRS